MTCVAYPPVYFANGERINANGMTMEDVFKVVNVVRHVFVVVRLGCNNATLDISCTGVDLCRTKLKGDVGRIARVLRHNAGLRDTMSGPPVNYPPFFPVFRFRRVMKLNIRRNGTNEVNASPYLLRVEGIIAVRVDGRIVLLPFCVDGVVSRVIHVAIFP